MRKRRATRRLVLVAGPGRSGTSLFAGLCARLGYRVPLPEVAADATNPRGFSEPQWAVDFHERLLASVDMGAEDGRPLAWEKAAKVCERPKAQQRVQDWLGEQFGQSDRVVVKDPRIAWFAPLYVGAAGALDADLLIVTMLRHPAESIYSRGLAYGKSSPPTTRLAGWINMMLGVETTTRSLKRAVVGHRDLLTDWRTAFSAVGGGVLIDEASDHQRSAADELVDPSLVRAEAGWTDLGIPAPLTDLATQVFESFKAQSRGEDRLPELDALRVAYDGQYRFAEEMALSSVRAARKNARRKALKSARKGQSEKD